MQERQKREEGGQDVIHVKTSMMIYGNSKNYLKPSGSAYLQPSWNCPQIG